jgi:hypothetical protein
MLTTLDLNAKKMEFPLNQSIEVKKIWLLAQALSTWVAPLILGI